MVTVLMVTCYSLSFVLHDTKSTEGLALYDFIKKFLKKLKLEIGNIVGQCYDGANNMSGVHKGLAIRIIGDSPRAIYIHCHAHRLNLALQAALSEIEPLRNALGTVQSIYTYLEASHRNNRHRMRTPLFSQSNFVSTKWRISKGIFVRPNPTGM